MTIRFSRPLTRSLATVATLLGISLAMLPAEAGAQTKIKMVMAWKWTGQMAWFVMAQEKGYFKAEGLDVEIDQGDGSAASIPKVASGTYDAGFGDINAVIDFAAKRPTEAPVAVYMMNNVSPFTIAIKKGSPIKTPKDLEGKTIGAPNNDAALKLFPAFAKAAGIDASKVTITNMAPNLREQMLLRDQIDAAFGYVSTVMFSAKLIGMDPDNDLRFINYADYGLNLYSNAVIFSRPFIKANPEAVKGFLRALNRSVKEVVADPDAGMESMMRREPLLNRKVETERLLYTLKHEMNDPEIGSIGVGDLDDARLKRSIAALVENSQLPRTPEVGEVFDRSFLPPRLDRLSAL
jgi:NitT/TauT family transport system substrate-binding protein